MNSHDRPFSCSICSKSFTRSENLKRHKRTRHGGETRKIFQCENCLCRFSRRDVCKRHIERCISAASRNLDPAQDVQAAPDEISTAVLSTDPAPPAVTTPSAPSISPPTDNSPSITWNLLNTAMLSADTFSEQTNITAYFTYFHPSLPLIHRPTFLNSSPPKLLVDIIVAIGLLYSAEISGFGHDKAAHIKKSQELWRKGVDELNRRAKYDWRELRKTWMMQSWLLHIVYGAFMENAAQAERGRKMLRSLVDSVRDLGLLKQVVATSASSPAAQAQAMDIHEQWQTYIGEESLKLCIYTVLFLDNHIFSCSNVRPLLSTVECLWELPLAASLWEAETAEMWYETRCREYDDGDFIPSQTVQPPYQGFMYTATQSILSEMQCNNLLGMLAASPFAMICILTNLDALVKDFTRCYYQLPPNPADPSAFHILTQSQTRQVHSAVIMLSTVIKERLAAATLEPEQSVWHACQVLTWSIKLSLCRPDDLLVGGIVENRVFAGLVTATHLTMGSYVTYKRTTHATQQHKNSHDGMLAVIDELTDALSAISALSPALATREPPWITAASYRLLLTIWRTLHVAAADINEKLGRAEGQLTSRSFGSSILIFNSILETVVHSGQWHDDAHNPEHRGLWLFDADTIISTLAEGEADLTKLIQKICRSRSVWIIGPSLADAMQDAMASAAG
ncbi:fungal-specific transcription factor domain-containing protein [Pestalotiopsis sp. NC0098]|nr:fungal-specific transcription factor domain-containing protein [Pestalotiopsis sp. NC0098]